MKKPKKKQQPPEKPHAPSSWAQPDVARSETSPETPAGGDVSDGEPMARSAAVPAALFVILGALLFWGDMHLVTQGGELDARVQYPFESIKEIESFHIKAAVDPRVARGEVLYNLVCNSCHQPDGGGGVAQGCPPLAGSDWVLAKDPIRIIPIVLKGLSGPIVVNGKSYGTGTMTPFGDSLSDEDIASVLSFVRNNWGNKAPLVDIADVKKIRAQFKDRGGYMDVPTLMGLQPKD